MSASTRPGRSLRHRLDGLVSGAGDPHDAMAEVGHQLLEVEGDQRLVLDDDDVGRHLLGDLAAGFVDQPCSSSGADVHYGCRILRRELLDSDEQEGLSGLGRQQVEVALHRVQSGMAACVGPVVVQRYRIEDLQEGPIKGHARWHGRWRRHAGSASIASSVETT